MAAERKVQLPVEGGAGDERPIVAAPMDIEVKSGGDAPMEEVAAAPEVPPKEAKKPAHQRIFATSMSEKIIDFWKAVDQGITLCVNAFSDSCDLTMKDDEVDPKVVDVLFQDLLNILRTCYSNAMQLQTCVQHQYNYERSTQPVDKNLQPIQPEFKLVGDVTTMRNQLALLIQGYTEFIAKNDIKQSYGLKREKKAIPTFRAFAQSALSDAQVISANAILTAYNICKTISPARFLIGDEKIRNDKMMAFLVTKYPALFDVKESVVGPEVKTEVTPKPAPTPRWPIAVEPPPRPVSAFRTPPQGGAKALADAKSSPLVQKRKNERRPGVSGALEGIRKEAKKS